MTKRFFLIPSLLLSTAFTFTDSSQHYELAKELPGIGNQFLTSCNLIKPNNLDKANPDEFKTSLKLPTWQQQTLSDFEKYHLAFEVLESYAESQKIVVDRVIDPIFIKKMELFCGGERPEVTFFSRWNNTKTAIGAATLASKLIQPSANVEKIKANQAILKEMIGNDQILHNLDTAFDKIGAVEDQLLMLWQKNENQGNKQVLQGLYFIFSDKPNKNAGFLRFWKGYNNFSQGLMLGVSAAATIGYPIYCYKTNGMAGLIGGTLYGAMAGGLSYITIRQAIQTETAALAIQAQLIDIATYLEQLKQIDTLIQSNEVLKNNIPSARMLHSFIYMAEHKSQDVRAVLDMLATDTFKGKASFFSNQGRVLAAYRIIREIKNELIPAFIAAGEVEAYVSMAKLYQSHKDNHATYSFVEFIENSKTPYLQAVDFWNPFINPDEVITNSVVISQDSMRNAIITGPNTGGKSTVLKALLIDLLLAQTFGIAPAKKLVITPFTHINCYLNITDDIAAGVSLFKAEVLRAKELINSVRALGDGEFSFTIMDEVFSGTSPKEGEEAAYLFCKQLGEQLNSATIIATHFKKLAELPEDTHGNYTNQHVEVIKHDDGTIERTFLLKAGPSFLNIAMDLLLEEGVLQAQS
ncbi:MAG: hypothetical protein Q8Q25_00775 [bacterium]|nr:hypothetical protein [bacterium]